MGKRKREALNGHPCNQRFALSELQNMELRYDGQRLHLEPGRRLRAASECPSGVVDDDMFKALNITDPHVSSLIASVIQWCASTWPEMAWNTEKLPYKVIMQKSHSKVLLVFHWPSEHTSVAFGTLDHMPLPARKAWVERTVQWRLVVPVSI